MFFTLQYTSIYLIQLSIFFAFNSPSYIGKSNFTSNLIKDVFFSFFSGLGDEDDGGDGGGDDGGRFPLSLCPLGHLEKVPLLHYLVWVSKCFHLDPS